MGHVNDHVQGHISSVFKPFPMPSGTASGGPSGDGILLEDGTSYLLLESGDYFLKE